MHIAHVSLAKKHGGGEMQQRLLMQQLAQYPIQQSLICPPEIQDFFKAQPIANLVDIHSIRGLLGGHNQIQADLLHAHCGRSIYWCLIEKILTGRPYLATRRVPDPVREHWASRLAYQKAAKLVAITRATAQSLPSNVSQDSITICHSTLAQNYEPNPTPKVTNPQSPNILQIGNLLTHKGYHTTFACAKQLAQSHPQATITILGERRDSDLSEQIDQHANIRYIGVTDPTPYYQQADLFIFPSWDEGMGSSLLEAMNHALPIIASNVGGIPEVIDHYETGLLIPPQSEQALYNAIVWALDHPQFCQAMGIRGHQKLTQFLPDKMAETYFNLYQSCLNN